MIFPGNPSTVNGYDGIDASTLGLDLSQTPLPATVSWTDNTSTKAVRFSLGALFLGKPEYARVFLKVISASQCSPIHADAFGGDAGGDQGGFSQLWRYYNPTVAELLPCAAMQKVVNHSVTLAGSNVVWQINFLNSGNVPFPNFTITDSIPSGLTYKGASPAPTTISGNTLSWNFGTVAADTNITIYLTNLCGTSGTYFNTATASSGTNVIGAGTDSVTVGSYSDLSAYGKSVTPSAIAPGGTVTYTIGITNTGDANNGTPLVIDETLPAGFTYQSLSSVYLNGAALSSSFYSVSTSIPSQPVFTIDSGIAPGNSLQLSFLAQCAATNANGTYYNTIMLNFENKTLGGLPMAPVLVGGASIGDFVFKDWNSNSLPDVGETGIPNVTVTLSNMVTHAVSTQVTSTNGFYDFTGLSAGTYVVSAPAGGAAGGPPAGYLNTTNLSYTLTLTNSQVVTSADFGFLPGGTGAIGQYVFDDANHNGVFDTGDFGISNATVYLYSATSNLVAVTTTSATNGNYLFTGLAINLAYYVEINRTNHAVTSIFGNTNFVFTTASTMAITNLMGTNLTANFGLYEPQPSSIGQYVYYDANNNSNFDAGDAPLAGVSVSLYLDATNSSGQVTSSNLLAQTTTSATGQYFFNNLSPGAYSVVVGTNSATAGYQPDFTLIPDILLGYGTNDYTVNFPFVVVPPTPPFMYKTVSSTNVAPAGTILTYTLVPNYTNNVMLSSVTVTDGIPAGTVFTNTPPNASGTTNGHATYVSWALGSTTVGTTNTTSNGGSWEDDCADGVGHHGQCCQCHHPDPQRPQFGGRGGFAARVHHLAQRQRGGQLSLVDRLDHRRQWQF